MASVLVHLSESIAATIRNAESRAIRAESRLATVKGLVDSIQIDRHTYVTQTIKDILNA